MKKNRWKRSARITAGLALILGGAACAPGTGPPVAGVGETKAAEPTWNPASADLVFMSNRDGNAEIYVLRGGEADWIRLTDDPGQSWYPRWSPDGRWLVYTAAVPAGQEDNLDVLAVEVAAGGEPIPLAVGPGREAEGRWRGSKAGG